MSETNESLESSESHAQQSSATARGYAALRARELEVAESSFQEALCNGEGLGGAHEGLGHVCAVRGAVAASFHEYARALSLAPSLKGARQGALRSLAMLVRSGDRTEIQNAFAQPGWKSTFGLTDTDLLRALETFTRAQALMATAGQLAAAGDGFLLCTEILPEFADAWSELGGVRLRQKIYDEASHCYRRTFELDPFHGFAKMGLAYVNLIRGNLEQAEEEFRKVISERPDFDEPYVALGWMCNDHGREQEAHQHFQRALDMNPRNDGALEGLGFVYTYRRELLIAEDMLRRCIDVNPNNGGAHVGLGNLLVEKRHLDEARALYDIALRISAFDESAHNGLGYISTAEGRIDEAIAHHKNALKFTPAQPFSHLALARLYTGRRDLDNARKFYHSALELLLPGDTRAQIEGDLDALEKLSAKSASRGSA